ncbi:MAG: hypothetical protein ACTSUE_22960 [Promethearchaeota archaeon]
MSSSNESEANAERKALLSNTASHIVTADEVVLDFQDYENNNKQISELNKRINGVEKIAVNAHSMAAEALQQVHHNKQEIQQHKNTFTLELDGLRSHVRKLQEYNTQDRRRTICWMVCFGILGLIVGFRWGIYGS